MWYSSKKYTLQSVDTISTEKKGLSKEDRTLADFKARIKDVSPPHHDDYYLRKWLKARSSDPKKAEEMYRASMAYRKKHNVDNILATYQPPKVLQEYLTGGFCGYDKEGSPVRVELFGYLDMKGIMYSAKKEDLEKTKLLQCETTVRDWKLQSKKLGRRVDGLTVIFDMDNVGTKSLWRPGLQMYLHLVKILEDNYPEMMKKMFVVNAPRIFPLLWKICRPLISEDMKNKIHVLGSDFKDVLLESVDADQLPVFLGGNLKDLDGNPRCKSRICQGGEVPKSYYLSEAADMSSMEVVQISKGDKHKIPVTADEPNSILRWEFLTADYDISFGVFYKNPDGSEEEVLPVTRVDCHMIPEDGSFLCTKPGTYALVFDNGYSWMRSKTIQLRYTLEEIPNEDIYVILFDNTYSWTRGKKLFYSVELLTSDSTTQAEVDQVSGGDWHRLADQLQVTRL